MSDTLQRVTTPAARADPATAPRPRGQANRALASSNGDRFWALARSCSSIFSRRPRQTSCRIRTLNILSNVAVIGIVSIGRRWFISGGFDLSVSGTVPLGAVAYAVLVNAGISVPPALLIVVLVGASVGLINGLVITRVGINPLVTTLATLSIASGVAYTISGGAALPFKDLGAAVLNGKTAGGVAYYVWAYLLLIVVGILVLRYTVFGHAIRVRW